MTALAPRRLQVRAPARLGVLGEIADRRRADLAPVFADLDPKRLGRAPKSLGPSSSDSPGPAST
jgi:hypothetical protein